MTNNIIFDENYEYSFYNWLDDEFKHSEKEDLEEIYGTSDRKKVNENSDTVINNYNLYLQLHFEDEEANLSEDLDENIICIGSLGLWNGRKQGYKELGNNLSEILRDNGCDSVQIYADAYNVRFKGYHHDGSNYILYRKWKSGLSEVQKENFLNRIYSGKKLTSSYISRYTESLLPYVYKIYGFKCSKKVMEKANHLA